MQETNNLHSPDRDGYFWMEPGTEPPPITVTSIKSGTTGSFKGLAERTVSTHFEMPKGGDGTKIIDADRHAMNNFEDSTRILIEPSLVPSESNQSIDDSPVLSTEQAVWTVGEDFEATLPPPVENTQQEQTRHDPIGLTQGLRSQPMPPSISFDYNLEPNWDDSTPLQHSYLGKLNEAEKLILTVSSVREISPSDPELQARLEVGRPRLSQLFNKLKRNGFLKVRKEGRTRFFKLTEEAFDVLR
jgi:DNA-binding transcriptional ArsR family regulator